MCNLLQRAIDRIPTDAQGQHIYEQASVEDTAAALIENAKGDVDDAIETAEFMRKKTESRVEKARKDAEEAEDPETHQDIKNHIKELEQNVQYWENVVQFLENVKKGQDAVAEEEAKAEANEAAPAAETSEEAAPKAEESDKDSEVDAPEAKAEDGGSLSSKIDEASAEVNTNPTEAQKEAGNYKKGHVKVLDFDITIEQPVGSVRRGTDSEGHHWEIKMNNTYGYFRGTEDVDGDHIDVFLSNDMDGWNGRSVFVVDQYNPDGTFDEHKVMLGFNSKEEARRDYLANYSEGWEEGRRIDVSSVSLEDFKKWMDSSKRKTKPFSEYSSVKMETDTKAPEVIGKSSRWGKVYQWTSGKFKDAVHFLMEKKDGIINGVFHRDDIGDISLGWGVAPNKFNGRGLAHIIKKHIETLKDFNSIDGMIHAIEDVIKNGKLKENKDGNYEVENDTYRVVIVNDEDGHWILSAFDYVHSKKEKMKRKDTAAIETPSQSNVESGAVDSNLSTDKVTESAATAQTEGKENDAKDGFPYYWSEGYFDSLTDEQKRKFDDLAKSLGGHIDWENNSLTMPSEEAAKKMVDDMDKERDSASDSNTTEKHSERAEDAAEETKAESEEQSTEEQSAEAEAKPKQPADPDANLRADIREARDLAKMMFPDVDAELLDKIARDLNQQPLTRKQREQMERIAKAFGLRIRWFKTMPQNGTYSKEKGVICIATDSWHQLSDTFGHEMTHALKNVDMEAYDRLKEAVIEASAKNEAERKGLQRAIDWKYSGYDAKDRMEEYVSDKIGAAIASRDLADKILFNLDHKVLGRMRDIVTKMRAAVSDFSFNTENKVRGLLHMEERVRDERVPSALEKLEGAIMDAYRMAHDTEMARRAEEKRKAEEEKKKEEERKKAEEKRKKVDEGVKRSERSMELGHTFSNTKEDFDAVRERAIEEDGIVMPNLNKENVKVVDVPRHDFMGNGEQARKQAKEWAKVHLQTRDEEDLPTMRDGTPYMINGKAIKKYLDPSSWGLSDNLGVHLAVLKRLKEVIHASVEAEIHPDYHKGEDGIRSKEHGYDANGLIHRLYGAVNIDGTIYRVKTTMQEFRNDTSNKPHSYEVTKIELLDAPTTGAEAPNSPLAMTSTNSISAAKLLKGVEKSYDPGKKLLDESEDLPEGETKFSRRTPTSSELALRDGLVERLREAGLGVSLSEEEGQRVLDLVNGGAREMRVYHGGGADFDRFDHSHMGEGEGAQVYGWGSYVTEVKGIGRHYADFGINSTSRHLVKKHPEYKYRILPKLEKAHDQYFEVKEKAERCVAWINHYNHELSFLRSGSRKGHEDEIASIRYKINDLTKELENYDKVLPDLKYALNNAVNEAVEFEDGIKKGLHHNLYTVEIPDDTGSNYIDFDGEPTEEQKKMVADALANNPMAAADVMLDLADTFDLADDDLVPIYKHPEHISKDVLADVLFRYLKESKLSGNHLYASLGNVLGSDKAASELLNEAGFTGIKYPADYRRGGRADGAKNYVIFNDKDLEITDHVRFFRGENGEAYGFTVDGKIYIDPKHVNAETPIHEYAHLWATALQQKDAKAWGNVVELMKGTGIWDSVREAYPELKTDDEIADEVLATYSGQRGAERLREEMRQVMQGEGRMVDKVDALSAMERVRNAIARFWRKVAEMLGIRYTKAEDVADHVLGDLLERVNPNVGVKTDSDTPQSSSNESGIRESRRVSGRLANTGNTSSVAQRIYEEAVRGRAFEWDEAWHDSLVSVKALQDALAKERGVDIRDLFDYNLGFVMSYAH